MSFARARARKHKKAVGAGVTKAQKQIDRANRGVKQTYVYQMAYDHAVRKTALENLSAVFLYAMHEKYQFGAGRLARLRDKMQSEFDAIIAKNVSVEEISEYLTNEIGLYCGEGTPNDKSRQRLIEFKAVKEMSAAFLMALLDEFGYKKKRLGDAYMHCADLSVRLDEKKITYDEIREKIKEVFRKGNRA
jgi:hypothetical protein